MGGGRGTGRGREREGEGGRGRRGVALGSSDLSAVGGGKGLQPLIAFSFLPESVQVVHYEETNRRE